MTEDRFVAVGPVAGAAGQGEEYKLPEWAEQPVAEVAEPDAAAVAVPCEVYTRVVGYLRPVQNFNPGKRQEFADRVNFAVPSARTPDGGDC